jgi:hypothetical protein
MAQWLQDQQMYVAHMCAHVPVCVCVCVCVSSLEARGGYDLKGTLL